MTVDELRAELLKYPSHLKVYFTEPERGHVSVGHVVVYAYNHMYDAPDILVLEREKP